MCGIAGQVFASERLPASGVLESMAERLAHRGPDGTGFFAAPGVGLVHRRLSIIDLAGGAQPMHDARERIVVVFNGEIYNYVELRRELADYPFRTSSDTEVLLALYLKYGTDLLSKLRGMFAFALYDRAQRSLFLARDRLGKKPLYFAARAAALTFGSELKAVLVDDEISRDLDIEALDDYLAHGFIASPLTPLRAIKKLAAGEALQWSAAGTRVWRYWNLRYLPKTHEPLDDAATHVRELVEESTRLRLRADVPVGLFLSGGLDSSVVGLAARTAGAHGLRTFSVGFADADLDERSHARTMAKWLGAEHQEIVLESHLADDLETLAWHLDDPISDPAALGTLHLSRLAAAHVKVVLTGDGGDEAFAGYGRYRRGRITRLYRTVPRALRVRFAQATFDRFPRVIADRLRRTHDASLLPWSEIYQRSCTRLDAPARARLASGPLAVAARAELAEQRVHAVVSAIDSPGDLDRMLGLDVATYLADQLMPKTDRTTMAHGLEARAPLLDHVLVEYAARLPDRHRLRGNVGKVVLRRAFPNLPASALVRPKQGFMLPVDRWLQGPLRGLVHDVLDRSQLVGQGLLDAGALSGMIAAQERGAQPNGDALWQILTLELWHRTWASGPSDARVSTRAQAQGAPTNRQSAWSRHETNDSG